MRNVRFPAFCAIALAIAVSSFAQDRSLWRTAPDIREGNRGSIVGTVAATNDARGELQLDPDDDRSSRVSVLTDSLTTQYNGFGGVINGQPEIFTGSAGFANVRSGDRIEVRGIGRGTGILMADFVTLLGRSVAAPQTGVGQTRSPSQGVSTPSASTTATADRVGPVEGTVQQVNATDGRIVIVTDRREVLNVRVSNATPVYYRGDAYRVANLEVGDRIRVEPDSSSSGGDLRARSIEVTRSAQEGSGTAAPRGNSLAGRVTRVDRTVDMIRIDSGRGEVRVDVATATDASGRRVRANDFQAGDRIEITGRYSPTAADLFIADSVRFTDTARDTGRVLGPSPTAQPSGSTEDVLGPPPAAAELASVTIYGTVRETLANSPQLVLRDTNGRTVRLNVLEDFVVRGRNNSYVTADRLKEGDSVVVKAYRDLDNNYIAQTIRIR